MPLHSLRPLHELLRTTLDNQAVPEMPLSQEVAFTEQYLAIEQTRLGDRLRVEIAISPDTPLQPHLFGPARRLASLREDRANGGRPMTSQFRHS